MSRGKTRERGFALLIVLWTLGLLALLGTQLLATARQDTQLARNLVDAAETGSGGKWRRATGDLREPRSVEQALGCG